MGVPSARSPVLVIFTPPSDASLVVVKLLTGAAGLNFDFSMFSFHVPSELSAANAAMAAIVIPRMSFIEMLCIRFSFFLSVQAPFELYVRGCLKSRAWMPGLRISGGTYFVPLIYTDSIPLDQLGADHITD